MKLKIEIARVPSGPWPWRVAVIDDDHPLKTVYGSVADDPEAAAGLAVGWALGKCIKQEADGDLIQKVTQLSQAELKRVIEEEPDAEG